MAQAPGGSSRDRALHRSVGPDDRLEPHHRDEIRRRAALDPRSADPSWLAPNIDGLSRTESRFAASFNGVLQHNRGKSGRVTDIAEGARLTRMYGPTVRCKRVRRVGGERSCINV